MFRKVLSPLTLTTFVYFFAYLILGFLCITLHCCVGFDYNFKDIIVIISNWISLPHLEALPSLYLFIEALVSPISLRISAQIVDFYQLNCGIECDTPYKPNSVIVTLATIELPWNWQPASICQHSAAGDFRILGSFTWPKDVPSRLRRHTRL